MSGFSFGEVIGASGPAKLLIEKVSNAFGRHFDPSQEVRMAEARAKVDRIRRVAEAETDLEIAELRQRAADRSLSEEMTKQANIESIIQKALPHLNDNASPGAIEDDWLTNHLEKSRLASDDEMQHAWARILAGEGNNPGSFSRKTVNIMADLDKGDAELFTELCRFVWSVDSLRQPLVFDPNHGIYNRYGVNFESINVLEALGLIQFSWIAQFNVADLPKSTLAHYHEKNVLLTFPKDEGNVLNMGTVLFTPAGRQLSTICEARPYEAFFDYVYDLWVAESLVPPRNERQGA